MNKNLLIFTRSLPNIKTYYYVEPAKKMGFNPIFISDFDDKTLGYNLINRQKFFLKEVNAISGFINHLNYHEIITRDRYLSNISLHLAKRLINSIWAAILEMFETLTPVGIIAFPVDNYVLELIVTCCKLKKIKIVNPFDSFIPGYIRINVLGEQQTIRENISQDEIENVKKNLLNENFKPSWLSKYRSRLTLFKLYLKERMKKIYFNYCILLKKDWYSFHYHTIFPFENVITIRGFSNIFIDKYFVHNLDIIEKKITAYNKVVLLPLQFAPETSLNYHINDYRFSDYFSVINKVVASSDSSTLFLIKEHPDMYGYRDPSFYKNITKFPNICLISPKISVNYLFQFSDVLIVTGPASTGAEALAKGKKVICLGGTYYNFHENLLEVLSYEEIHKWKDLFHKIFSTSFDLDAYIKNLLSSTMRGAIPISPFAKEDLIKIGCQNVVSLFL